MNNFERIKYLNKEEMAIFIYNHIDGFPCNLIGGECEGGHCETEDCRMKLQSWLDKEFDENRFNEYLILRGGMYYIYGGDDPVEKCEDGKVVKIYVSHPIFYGNPISNRVNVNKIIGKLSELYPDYIFISPLNVFQYLDLYNENNKEKFIKLSYDLMNECNSAWFFGDWKKSEICRNEYNNGKAEKFADFSPSAIREYVSYTNNPYRTKPSSELEKLLDFLNDEVYITKYRNV